VVIHGAAGGVGSIGVHLARWAGARVIGTGRAGARQRVLDLGADDFVDVERHDWETAMGQVDLVYDAIGGDVLAHSPAIVKPGGALVSVMAPPRRIEKTSARSTSCATRAVPNYGRSPAWSTRARCNHKSARSPRGRA
jgi:NADPH:quinone reductase-like Zn-dependent oxidoreductase